MLICSIIVGKSIQFLDFDFVKENPLLRVVSFLSLYQVYVQPVKTFSYWLFVCFGNNLKETHFCTIIITATLSINVIFLFVVEVKREYSIHFMIIFVFCIY